MAGGLQVRVGGIGKGGIQDGCALAGVCGVMGTSGV